MSCGNGGCRHRFHWEGGGARENKVAIGRETRAGENGVGCVRGPFGFCYYAARKMRASFVSEVGYV